MIKFDKNVRVEYARIVMREDQPYIMFTGHEHVKTAAGVREIDIYYKMKINVIGRRAGSGVTNLPQVYHCHFSEFFNLKCFLDAEGKNRDFTFCYYADNDSQVTKEAGLCRESLIIEGKCHRVCLSDVYRPGSTARPVTSMNSWEPGMEYEKVEAKEIA